MNKTKFHCKEITEEREKFLLDGQSEIKKKYISNTNIRKEMFYLTTHSTHFIYGYMASRHMVNDHSDSERKAAATTWTTLFD